MRVSQIKELNSIDLTITDLHQNLRDLYDRRASIVGARTSGNIGDDSIDLTGIDLSLSESSKSFKVSRKEAVNRKN